MLKIHGFSVVAWLGLFCAAAITASAQQTLTWEQVRLRFEQNNPTLLAGKLSVEESKASEITAFLRPNPEMSKIRLSYGLSWNLRFKRFSRAAHRTATGSQ